VVGEDEGGGTSGTAIYSETLWPKESKFRGNTTRSRGKQRMTRLDFSSLCGCKYLVFLLCSDFRSSQ